MREAITSRPVTVIAQTTIAEVRDLMRELDVRDVPVVRDGALVGILSDRDLGHLNIPGILAAEGADTLRRELATPVVNVMNSEVIFVEPDTEVVRILIEEKVGALPVVRPDSREVVGIVSYIDVLRPPGSPRRGGMSRRPELLRTPARYRLRTGVRVRRAAGAPSR
jgi:acetoin utilization protein AcuB